MRPDTLSPMHETSPREALPSEGVVPENATKKKIPFIVMALGASAAGACLLYGGDVAFAYVTDSPDPPKIVSMSPKHEQQKRAAQIYLFSGAGRETSQFTALYIKPTAEKYNVGVNYHHYGHKVDPEKSAVALNENNCQLSVNGKKVKTIVQGASTGAIVAEEVLSLAAALPDSCTEPVGAILESPLTGSDDLKPSLADMQSLVVKNDIAYFGKIGVFLNHLDGARQRSDYTVKAVMDAWDNAMNTRPPLVSSQLKYINRGMQATVPVKTVEIRSQDSDSLLDSQKVTEKLRFFVGDKLVTIDVPGARHAESWLDFRYPVYAPAYEEAFKGIYSEYTSKVATTKTKKAI